VAYSEIDVCTCAVTQNTASIKTAYLMYNQILRNKMAIIWANTKMSFESNKSDRNSEKSQCCSTS